VSVGCWVNAELFDAPQISSMSDLAWTHQSRPCSNIFRKITSNMPRLMETPVWGEVTSQQSPLWVKVVFELLLYIPEVLRGV
jgi:hypothetical protein